MHSTVQQNQHCKCNINQIRGCSLLPDSGTTRYRIHTNLERTNLQKSQEVMHCYGVKPARYASKRLAAQWKLEEGRRGGHSTAMEHRGRRVDAASPQSHKTSETALSAEPWAGGSPAGPAYTQPVWPGLRPTLRSGSWVPGSPLCPVCRTGRKTQ